MIEKVFFIPGQLVKLKHELDNLPTMLVTEVVTNRIKTPLGEGNHFKGIRCIWFSTNLELQEHIFSTKDLNKV